MTYIILIKEHPLKSPENPVGSFVPGFFTENPFGALDAVLPKSDCRIEVLWLHQG